MTWHEKTLGWPTDAVQRSLDTDLVGHPNPVVLAESHTNNQWRKLSEGNLLAAIRLLITISTLTRVGVSCSVFIFISCREKNSHEGRHDYHITIDPQGSPSHVYCQKCMLAAWFSSRLDINGGLSLFWKTSQQQIILIFIFGKCLTSVTTTLRLCPLIVCVVFPS